VLLGAAAAASAAEPPPPGGITELAGPRTLALSASVGTATGNDGLWVNAGALAARRRYEGETGVFIERRGSENVTQLIGGSVVDSITSAVAAGFSYRRSMEGDYQGNVYHLALAGPIAQRFFLGVAGKWLSLDGPEVDGASQDMSALTVDAGFLFQVTSFVSIGGAGYNLVPIENTAVAPTGAGAGIDVGSERAFHVVADWRIDFDRGDGSTNRYAAGAEYLLGGLMPLRGGWTYDETLDTQWWSAGVGLVTKDVALDVGYRQSLDASSARMFSAAIRLYVFD
jgi:hypothetical protein